MSTVIAYTLIGLILAIGVLADKVPAIWETEKAWNDLSDGELVYWIVCGCIAEGTAYVLGWPYILYCDFTLGVKHGKSIGSSH